MKRQNTRSRRRRGFVYTHTPRYSWARAVLLGQAKPAEAPDRIPRVRTPAFSKLPRDLELRGASQKRKNPPRQLVSRALTSTESPHSPAVPGQPHWEKPKLRGLVAVLTPRRHQSAGSFLHSTNHCFVVQGKAVHKTSAGQTAPGRGFMGAGFSVPQRLRGAGLRPAALWFLIRKGSGHTGKPCPLRRPSGHAVRLF